MTIATRRPTGKAPWPMLLVAGREKTGKSWSCAAASGSDQIGRTLWIPVGEDDPDELALVPGADFEIVLHDGTYPGIARAVEEAVAEPDVDGKPTLIVLDGETRLWNLISNLAQAEANQRRKGGAGDAPISMDLWNRATARHARIINKLKEHDGPVLITARLDVVTLMDAEGKPTKDKDLKVQAQKHLVYDVGGIVEIHAIGDARLAGVRSVRLAEKGRLVQLPADWSIPWLWDQIGAGADVVAPRQAGSTKHVDAPAAIDWVAEAQKAGEKAGKEAVLAVFYLARDDDAPREVLEQIVQIGKRVEAEAASEPGAES